MRFNPFVSSLLVALTLPAVALAQVPPPPAPATAGSAADLRAKGKAALAANDIPGACSLFEQSYQVAQKEQAAGKTGGPTPSDVLYDMADCHEKQGKGAVAAAEFEQVAQIRAAEAAARAAALRAAPPPAPVPVLAPPAPPAPPPPVVAPAPFPPAAPPAPFVTGTPAAPPAPPPPPPHADDKPVRVGDFMDTRLSWTIGDDDLLHDTGVAQPLSPNLNVGDRRQYRLFFDNLNSRFGGRENLTHLALYKRLPGYIEDLDTEASLVLRFDMGELGKGTGNVNKIFGDAGSYIRGFYKFSESPEGRRGLGVTLWPIDTDRFRLGYLYDISWGGTNPYINQSIFPRIQGTSPGFRVQYEAPKYSFFYGMKFASLSQVEQSLTSGTSEVEQVRISQTNYGFLFGGSVDASDMFRVDAGAGYFQQGTFELPDVSGESVYTFGASARLVLHHKDMKVPTSVDYRLYRNDPQKPEVIFAAEKYEADKTTWNVSLEGSQLMQNLKDFDSVGGTALQPARAAALQGTIKSGYARASLTGIYRDLPFVLRNQPSYIPFQTLPKDAATNNEIFLAAAADYNFPKLHLTPGIGGGVQFPATFASNSVDMFGALISRTVVVREQGSVSILPLNTDAVPIIQVRASLKWEASPILSTIAWVQFVHDNNGTAIERDPSEGTFALRTFLNADYIGFGMSAQARF